MRETSGRWTDLGGGIRVRQSVAFEMNSVLLLDAEHTVVVDPGILPSEIDELAAAVREVRPKRITLFFTHADWDHVLGRPWFPEARILAHDRLAGVLARRRDGILREATAMAESHGERWTRGFEPFQPDEAVSGLRFLRLDPWKLVLRDAPGHCDHQLNAHLPEPRVLIAADTLSDIEIPELGQAPAVMRSTLQALEPLAEGGAIELLIPGHGSIARGRDAVLERLHRDLAYLEVLERAARAALREGLAPEAAAERLLAMEYPGRGLNGRDTAPQHRTNVEHVIPKPAVAQGIRPSRDG
jgi:glyoxylase-like metal-dependent hydrolase (beta-lactamase superfamily II)